MTLSATMIQPIHNSALTIASVPAEYILLKEISYTANERKHLKKTLPWTLEEHLVDDIDNLHIVTTLLNDHIALAAIVRKDILQQILNGYEKENLTTKNLVPEQLLLPWQENQWTIQIKNDGKRWLFRTHLGSGFVSSRGDLELILQTLVEEKSLPEKIIGYTNNVDQDKEYLSDILHSILPNEFLFDTITIEFYPSETIPSVTKPLINLRQGEFSQKIPWNNLWHQWRKPIFVVAAAFFSYMIYATTDYLVEKQNDLRLRQQIEQTYRKAIPTGNMVEPVRQLKRKVSQYNTTNGSNLVSLIHQIGQKIQKENNLELQALNYNESKNTLQLTLLASSFNAIETLRKEIEQAGLKAKLLNSNAEGEKIRARIEVAGN